MISFLKKGVGGLKYHWNTYNRTLNFNFYYCESTYPLSISNLRRGGVSWRNFFFFEGPARPQEFFFCK